jgi:hypothetical protein
MAMESSSERMVPPTRTFACRRFEIDRDISAGYVGKDDSVQRCWRSRIQEIAGGRGGPPARAAEN